ncbi:MAG: Epoxyqueuosine reductase [Phycisphaerae bacterium]|nr:Epoxyqueuosine reductase [Phycisphaerae bacterium]
MTPDEKSACFRKLGRTVGFDQVGITTAGPIDRADYVREWLADGRAGQMHYLHQYLDRRVDSAQLLPGARSVIMAAANYQQPVPPRPTSTPTGRVARYAWGQDYHRVLKSRLHQLLNLARLEITEPFQTRVLVDTAPLLERDHAARAGLGWIGKNTLVLNRELGSYFLLGAIITTLELQPDSPATDHCGSCTRCLETCPTQAFPQPYQMDARRCLAYHTIELREEIPAEYHAALGDWLFGCDICQEVCPFNRSKPTSILPEFVLHPPAPFPEINEILRWGPDEYDQHLSTSAMNRATLPMLQRNARLVLNNLESDP